VGDEYETARTQLALAYATPEATPWLELCEPVFHRLNAALDLAAAQALRARL
jgi:hypothetical protein